MEIKETRRWKTILPKEENSFTNRIITLIRELEAIIWQHYDFSKNEDAGDVWRILVDDLHSLIDFLRQEHYQGHKIGQEPLIVDLRERLNMAVVTIELYEHEHPNSLCDNFDTVMHLCEDWQDWINRYFPIDPNGQEQPHQEQAPAAKASRPSQRDKMVKDCMLLQDDEKKDELLIVLHALIENKIGKWPALVIAVSVRMGLLIKPKYKMVVAEFGYIGAESGFNRHYKNGLKAFDASNPTMFGFSKDEIDTIKGKLSCFVVPGSSDK